MIWLGHIPLFNKMVVLNGLHLRVVLLKLSFWKQSTPIMQSRIYFITWHINQLYGHRLLPTLIVIHSFYKDLMKCCILFFTWNCTSLCKSCNRVNLILKYNFFPNGQSFGLHRKTEGECFLKWERKHIITFKKVPNSGNYSRSKQFNTIVFH